MGLEDLVEDHFIGNGMRLELLDNIEDLRDHRRLHVCRYETVVHLGKNGVVVLHQVQNIFRTLSPCVEEIK